MTLGQKIRALRKEKHLTQSALAGEEITRNMLSRIESDDALPSLPTLLYLSGRLDVPAGYFLSDDVSLLTYKKEKLLPNMKHWYSRGNHKEVVRLYRRDFTEKDDELSLLVGESALFAAKDAMHRGNMKTAEEYLSLAKELLQSTVYATSRHRAIHAMLAAALSSIQTPRFALAASEYEQLASDAVWEDFYRFLTEKTEGFTFRDPLFAEYAHAKAILTSGKTADALPALLALEEKKSTPGFSVLLLFRLYGDLESCYKEYGNFEEAYRYASKRLSLLSAFRG